MAKQRQKRSPPDALFVEDWARILGVAKSTVYYAMQGESFVFVPNPKGRGRPLKAYHVRDVARVFATMLGR